jgi:hypothetical protein
LFDERFTTERPSKVVCGTLLVLEHPEVPVQALRLERLEFHCQVTERVDSRGGHVCTLYQGDGSA